MSNTLPSHRVTTVLGLINMFAAFQGVAYNPAAYKGYTINTKRNVLPEQLPIAVPKIRYFGIGVKGTTVLSADEQPYLSQPYQPQAGNQDLHLAIPVRMVSVDAPLSAEDEAKYRIKTAWPNAEAPTHYCYWLKKLEFNNPISVRKLVNTVPGGYEFSDTSANPKVYKEVIQNLMKVSVTSNCVVALTHEEVASTIDAMYNGNEAYYRITEIGLYSGEDYDAGDRTEAVGTHLAVHHCINGWDASPLDFDARETFQFENASSFIS